MAHLNHNRSKLLIGCGSAAMAMGMLAAPNQASAQAIQATETIVSGDVGRVFTATGSEVIILGTPTAVIDWTPDQDNAGNALDFLPNGNDVTFQNDGDQLLGEFAVLNRILPSANGNIAVIDGTVISQIIDGQGLPIGPGGTVAFYSPTGLLIGDNALFDVGNLILTTLDIDLASFDNFALNGGQLQMGGTPTTARVQINPGAVITASAENSFFAVTAAEIQMFGTSDINGSQAYVAGEAVNITVSNGLFDIQIPTGTTVGNAIVFDGDVGGPSSTGVTGDNHLIYAVAAAQTDPISLLFSGNLGFQPAASAGIVNGEIILSANYDVSGRSAAGGNVSGNITQLFDNRATSSDVAGSVFLTDFTASSSILAVANEEVQVTAFNGPSSIDGNLFMLGANFSELTASNGQDFTITGDVLVTADDLALEGAAFQDTSFIDAQAGSAFIDAFGGGTLSIGGNVEVSASAFAGFDVEFQQAGSATGGDATVASTDGSLFIAGEVDVVATGGILPTFNDILSAGTLTGGTAQIFATGNGQVTIDGLAFLGAGTFFTADGSLTDTSTGSDGVGGLAILQSLDTSTINLNGGAQLSTFANAGDSNISGPGASATAGSSIVFIGSTGSIDIVGDLTLDASARGGFNQAGQGGEARGGGANVFFEQGGTLDISGDFLGVARATGGSGDSGGDAFGGFAGLRVDVGTITVGGNAEAIASGRGGSAVNSGGDGGRGEGGNAFLQASGTLTGTASLTIAGDATATADGEGGNGGDATSDSPAGNGGIGLGGQFLTPNQANPQAVPNNGAFILAGGDNGSISVGGISIAQAAGTGGNGGAGATSQAGGRGGDAFGGLAQVGLAFLLGDGSIGNGSASFGAIEVDATAFGGNGGAAGPGSTAGDGGTGQGGDAVFGARAGTAVAGDVLLLSDADGGFGNIGGEGLGGNSVLSVSAGGSATIASLNAISDARGGTGTLASGLGSGGGAAIDVFDVGELTINGDVLLQGFGFGGSSSTGEGGSGNGGDANIRVDGEGLVDEGNLLTINGNVRLDSTGFSGSGLSSTLGAEAEGGDSRIEIQGLSTVFIDGDIDMQADGNGGNNIGTGKGGTGIGGESVTLLENGAVFELTGDYDTLAFAMGGVGFDGGDAFAGMAAFIVEGGAEATVGGNLFVNSDARGGAAIGAGGRGGDGQAGQANIAAIGSETLAARLTIGGEAGAFSNGFGGVGGNGDGDTIAAGRGGDGFGGNFDFVLAGDDNEVSFARIAAGSDNGFITVSGASTIAADGTGGAGGNGGPDQAGGTGGDGLGGDANVGTVSFLDASPLVGNGSIQLGTVAVSSNGIGGAGGFGGSTTDPRGNGGNGTGNRALASTRGGSFTATDVFASGNGTGGEGGVGGTGTGGERVGVFTNTTDGGTINIDSLIAVAIGQGGFGFNGDGGAGIGGQSFMGFQGGTTTVTGDVSVDSTGFGGSSANGDGGDGTGGVADLAVFTASAGTGDIAGNARVVADGFGGDGGVDFTGGVGTGGRSFVQAQAGGTISIGSLLVAANGTGGSGDATAGGAGVGGLAELISADSGSQVTVLNANENMGGSSASSILGANGQGGIATGGTGIGGTGSGGESILSAVNGGSITLSSDPAAPFGNAITARGFGGEARVDGGTGGAGFGGLGLVEVDGGTVDAGRVFLSVFSIGGQLFDNGFDVSGGDATGGVRNVTVTNGGELTIELFAGTSGGQGGAGSGSGTGGNGSGGNASLLVENSTLNLVGRNIVPVQNAGGTGSIGGDATGGEASVNVTDSVINFVANADGIAELLISGPTTGGAGIEAGGNATGANVTVAISGTDITGGGAILVNADAVGGSASDAMIGQGGSATGGTVTVDISGSDLQLATQPDTTGFNFDPSGQQTPITIPGTLNSFSANAIGGTGVFGGDATGGNVDLTLTGSTVSIAGSMTQAGLLSLSATATGGAGNPGNASGGTINLSLVDSILNVAGLMFSANGIGGDSGDDDNDPTADGGSGEGGQIDISIDGSTVNLTGSSSITADGLGGRGLVEGGDGEGGRVDLDIVNSDVDIGASLTISADGTGGLGGGTVGFSSGGSANLFVSGSQVSGGALSLAANSTGTVPIDPVTGEPVLDTEGGDVGGGDVRATFIGETNAQLSSLNLSATGTTSPGDDANGGFARLQVGSQEVPGASIVNVGNVDIDVNATGGSIDGSGEPANEVGQFTVRVLNGRLVTQNLRGTALGDALPGEQGPSALIATGGDIQVSNDLFIDVFDNFEVRTANNSIIGGPNVSSPSADIDIFTDGTLRFFGDNDDFISFGGASVLLSSNDIEINEGSRIGGNSFNLVSTNEDATALLGELPSPDPSATFGYTLSQAEAARIDAGTASFTAPIVTGQSGSLPDILIGDITVFGSLEEGVSSLSISTPGAIRVAGQVRMISAAATDQLRINAGETLEVIIPTGGISITGPDESLAGSLSLSSQTIVAAVADLAAQIAEDPQFAGLADALNSNDGTLDADGYIRANSVAVVAGENILIQNTGTNEVPGGILVGDGGLIIGQLTTTITLSGQEVFTFSGTLSTPDEVLFFEFTVADSSNVTLRTFSYAGGTAGDGTEVPAGGFDPILALFGPNGDLIGQNDDGDGVPADPVTGSRFDTLLELTVPPGDYTASVSVFPNFAGDNINDPFQGTGETDFGDRTPFFFFEVRGADSVSGPGTGDPINVFAYGSRVTSDGGRITGNAFFDEVNFGDPQTLASRFAEAAMFNNCSILNGCDVGETPTPPPPPPPPPPIEEAPPVNNPAVVAAPIQAAQPVVVTEQESNDEFGIDFPGLLESEELEEESDIEDPVASGGDSSLYGQGASGNVQVEGNPND